MAARLKATSEFRGKEGATVHLELDADAEVFGRDELKEMLNSLAQ